MLRIQILEADKDDAAQAGFSAHITKPYMAESLLDVLNRDAPDSQQS